MEMHNVPHHGSRESLVSGHSDLWTVKIDKSIKQSFKWQEQEEADDDMRRICTNSRMEDRSGDH
jgi:hypothetical protein